MKFFHAAATILVDPDKRILVQQRPADSAVMPHYWEFPGGKLQDGETPLECARREVWEETGLTMGCSAPLNFISETRNGESRDGSRESDMLTRSHSEAEAKQDISHSPEPAKRSHIENDRSHFQEPSNNLPYHIIVYLYLCREWEGIPQPKLGQAMKWLRVQDLNSVDMLPGNLSMIPYIRDTV